MKTLRNVRNIAFLLILAVVATPRPAAAYCQKPACNGCSYCYGQACENPCCVLHACINQPGMYFMLECGSRNLCVGGYGPPPPTFCC
jgi:hypothetical protein